MFDGIVATILPNNMMTDPLYIAYLLGGTVVLFTILRLLFPPGEGDDDPGGDGGPGHGGRLGHEFRHQELLCQHVFGLRPLLRGAGKYYNWVKLPDTTSGSPIDHYYLDYDGGKDDRLDEKVRQYKSEIVSAINRYFLSLNIQELIHSLEVLALPQYNPVFLKKLITSALDRKNCEKELTSVLLCYAY